MIVPVTSEVEWMPIVEAAASWQPAACAKVCVIAPHPDDETLSAGGLIARLTNSGADVTVIAVTDGENAYTPNAGLADLRVREQESALFRLCIKPSYIRRLRIVDSGVSQSEGSLRAALCELIVRGSLVLAPWPGDFHPDHEACGRAAHNACEQVGANCVFYFFWTWHRGRPELLKASRFEKFRCLPTSAKPNLMPCLSIVHN